MRDKFAVVAAPEPERNLAAEVSATGLLVGLHLSNPLADAISLGLSEGCGALSLFDGHPEAKLDQHSLLPATIVFPRRLKLPWPVPSDPAHQGLIERVADALLAAQTLDQDEIDALLGDVIYALKAASSERTSAPLSATSIIRNRSASHLRAIVRARFTVS
jgi:hypothetical protein